MSYPEYQVTWFRKTSGPGDAPMWETTGTDLTEVIDISVTESISDGNTSKQDTFDIELPNYDSTNNGLGNPVYQIGADDLIEIRFGRDGGSKTLVMSGKVVGENCSISVDQRRCKIGGINRTQSLLRSVFAIDIASKKPPEMVAAVLGEVNEFNENSGTGNKLNYVYYDETQGKYLDQDGVEKTAGDVTIQRLKSDGTAFTTVENFSGWYDNAYTLVQKLSGWDITGDGTYIFYVDSTNTAYWLSKSTSISGTLKEGRDFLNLKIDKDVDKVVNFFVIHCGTGPAGYGILTFASNDESIAAHGLSGKFLDRTYIAEQIMKIEREQNSGSFDTDFPKGTNGFYPSSFPYTFYFKARTSYTVGGTSYSVGDTIQVADQEEYNEAIVKECEARGETEASPILDILGQATWKVEGEFKGNLNYSRGNLTNIESGSKGWTGSNIQRLRIHEINHKYNQNGWRTTYYLRQDEETVS